MKNLYYDVSAYNMSLYVIQSVATYNNIHLLNYILYL